MSVHILETEIFKFSYSGHIAVLRTYAVLPTEYSVVFLLVCVTHTSEPCKNGWTDRDAVWVVESGEPKEALSLVYWAQIPMRRG